MGKDSGEIFDDHIKGAARGTSLEVQWLRLLASNAGGAGSVPGQGTKIAHAARPRKKKRKIYAVELGFKGSGEGRGDFRGGNTAGKGWEMASGIP